VGYDRTPPRYFPVLPHGLRVTDDGGSTPDRTNLCKVSPDLQADFNDTRGSLAWEPFMRHVLSVYKRYLDRVDADTPMEAWGSPDPGVRTDPDRDRSLDDVLEDLDLDVTADVDDPVPIPDWQVDRVADQVARSVAQELTTNQW